jgi:hypothetical protein
MRVLLSVLVLVLAWAPAALGQFSQFGLRIPQRFSGFPPDFVLITRGDRTTQAGVWSSVDGLQRPFAAADTIHFRCRGGYVTAGGSTAMQLSINGPFGSANVRYTVTQFVSVVGIHGASENAYLANTNPATGPGPSITVPWWIVGTIESGSTPGVFEVLFRTETNNQAVTIHRGASCAFY